MNEIYGCRLKGRRCLYRLRHSFNFLFYIILVVLCWLHQYAFLHLCSTCCNRCVFFYLIVSTLPRASHGNMFSFQVTFFAPHISCQKAEIQSTTQREKIMLAWTPQAINLDREKRGFSCDSFPLCSALPTPTDIAGEDPLEEEFRCRRQNALPGLGLHQRYLRNSAQNPSEEEEEHGLQSLGLTRGPPTRHCRAD